MSDIDRDTVTNIARLARLAVAEEKKQALADELSSILTWVEQLSEVKTDDVPPLASVVKARLRWRDDRVTDGGKQDDIVANAPHAEYGFFAVPKVIE